MTMKKIFLILLTLILTLSVSGACSFGTFAEGIDRTYSNGDTLIRGGDHYKVKVAGWANATASDGTWAPGTGSSWTSAWEQVFPVCSTPPVVKATVATHIDCSSGILRGVISSDGGEAITGDGFIYYTDNVDKEIGDAGVTQVSVDKLTTGDINKTIGGLATSTTYYYRAYSTNSIGTSYSSKVSFYTCATTYYSCSGVNTWDTDPSCPNATGTPTSIDYCIMRDDWRNASYKPITHPAHVAHGTFMTARPYKLTVQSGGYVYIEPGGNPLTMNMQLFIDNGGFFASNSAIVIRPNTASSLGYVENNGTMLIRGSMSLWSDLSGVGKFCKDGAWVNETGGSINGVADITGFFNETEWGIANTCGQNGPLPVELISFSATRISDNLVSYNWVTGVEINNDYFMVEVSIDGLTWDVISYVNGSGNTSITTKYGVDEKTSTLYKYARLVQVDYDNTTSYSNIRNISVDNDKTIIIPTPSGIIIESNTSNNVFIYNSIGKIVYNQSTTPGYNLITLQVSSGFYFVRIGFSSHKIFIR